MKRKLLVVLAILVVFCWATVASGDLIVTGTSGNLAASADFSVVGGNLQVVLTNTSTADVLVPGEVLTALFFSVGQTLTPVSALLDGSTVFFGPTNGGNVGGEWAYGSGLSGAPLGASAGISSSGFGLFGNANFNGVNLQGPTAVDGIQYGITSAGDNPATGNAAVTGGNALIQDHVIFTLSGIPAGFMPSLDTITDISFQYGTALTDRNVPGVPIPPTALLLGSGLLGLAGLGWRRRKS